MSGLSGIRLQLLILGSLRATEAIAWTSIFPYAYFMIVSFPGVAEAQIPLFAGLLIAIFTFCEFLSGMVWARVADRVGRKKALLVGSVCGTVTPLTFGLSRSIYQAAASRAFGGLLNPNNSLVSTCVVELAARKAQRAKALSWVTFIRSMGNLIGPVLGGLLADPVTLYPSVFPTSTIWTTYRYLLPNLVVVVLQATTMIAVFLFLEETQPRLTPRADMGLKIGHKILTFLHCRHAKTGSSQYIPLQVDERAIPPRSNEQPEHDADAHELGNLDGEGADDEDTGPGKTHHRVFTPQVILQILSVSLLAFHKVSSDAIMPTFLATPRASTPTGHGSGRSLLQGAGGFEYSSQKIGLILLAQAVFAMAIQVTLVPRFISKLSTLTAYRIILCIYPVSYIFTPALPSLEEPLSLITVLLDLSLKVFSSSTGYVCSAILISDTAPAKVFLARINGAAASFSCLSRSVGPLVTGKLFEVGLHAGYVGMAFWVLGGVALGGAIESLLLRDHVTKVSEFHSMSS
ncbi:major facilitator superfamily domain-containing protein [Xylariomycetidae sp. FL0641]|nr:major facilitator superfamily domain-containing protein [Xylariomycetidae sp. FL0641]